MLVLAADSWHDGRGVVSASSQLVHQERTASSGWHRCLECLDSVG